MSLTAKDATKVRKLIALSLDSRGQKAEADAAGLKAIRMCRDAGVSAEEFAGIFGSEQPTPTPQPGFRNNPFEDAFNVGIESGLEHIFESLSGKRRRARA